MSWLDWLYQKRFIIFIISLTAILFGNLIFPEKLYQFVVARVFLVVNVLTGILLVHNKKGLKKTFVGILILILLTYLVDALKPSDENLIDYFRFGLFFLFYALVTIEVISQVWRAKQIKETVILGLISGYICLGLLGFFLCMSIEFIEPGSFSGVASLSEHPELLRQNLFYYSYITLMTIGYGEIVPVSELARNAAVLIGLLGQFYLVIITAIVVGKFLIQNPSSK